MVISTFGVASCSSEKKTEVASYSDSFKAKPSPKYIHDIGFSLAERIVGFPLFGTIAVNEFTVEDASFNNQRIMYYEVQDAVMNSMPLNYSAGLFSNADIYDTNHFWEALPSDMFADEMIDFLDKIGAADEIVYAKGISEKPEFTLNVNINKFYIIAVSRKTFEDPENLDKEYLEKHGGLISHRIQEHFSSGKGYQQKERSKNQILQYTVVLEMAICVTDTANNSAILANTYREEILISDGEINDAIEAISDAVGAIYQHFATDLMGRLS
ncbi:MAG: hypothetical protein GY804_13095 [Alphaproteobacteria bacterium]|nr:hypothetical protein [Alphaproteobacteria bacterium]